MKLNRVNLVYSYYENKDMLAAHLINWNSYSEDQLRRMRIIIVDDCSKLYPAKDVIRNSPLPITLYRINTDIPWNQHGAKNLAMWEFHEREQDEERHGKEWCVLTDMDIVFTAPNFLKIQQETLSPGHYYQFERMRMPDMELYKHHPNTIAVRSDKYWEAGGYDEDYCGSYGGDGQFERALRRHCLGVKPKDIYAHYYGRTYITHSGTNDLERDGKYKKIFKERLNEKRANNNEEPKDWIRFEWEKIR